MRKAKSGPVAIFPSCGSINGLEYANGKAVQAGDVVRRSTTWAFGNQDFNQHGKPGTGVVTGTRATPDSWVDVVWESGYGNDYRVGDGGHFDIELVRRAAPKQRKTAPKSKKA